MQPYEKLEEKFKEWVNPGATDDDMVACNSGTAALHLALETLSLGKQRYVAVPDYTMYAVPRAVELAGMIPVFVDVNPYSLTVCPIVLNRVAQRVSLAAVINVATYGYRSNSHVWSVAKDHRFMVIEDLAEAHGVRVHPESAAACWSFYKNKIIAGEEGGAVLFRNPVNGDRARSLRSLGFTKAHDYNHIPGGHNYRLANALAGPILDSLAGATANIARRKYMYNLWAINSPQEIRMPFPPAANWVFPVRVPGMRRELMGEIVKAIQEVGVQARYGFLPMTQQVGYIDRHATASWADNRVSRVAGNEVFYLPLLPVIEPARVREVMGLIIELGLRKRLR